MSLVRVKLKGRMMDIKAVTGVEALDLLNFMGANLFIGKRLQRFTQDNIHSIASTDNIDQAYLLLYPNQNRKLFGIYDPEEKPLGGLIIKYYLWERLKNQLYFNISKNNRGEVEKFKIERLSSIVEEKLNKEEIDIAIELAYFVVREEARGKGIGKVLFQKFVDSVQSNPEKYKLAFTIALGKYSFLTLGEKLMRYILQDKEGKNIGKEINFLEIANEADLPKDFFEADLKSLPTIYMAKKFHFTFLGIGKYLGEVWGKIYS